MKKIILFLILLILIPSAAAGNVTIKGVPFEIPQQYEHGTLKNSSYVYESGLTFRILALDDYKNLRFNYGSDIEEADSCNQTTIAGHDAIVINNHYNNKNYTTVYFASGDTIFLVCFNDTYVNEDIIELISKTPQQSLSHEDFVNTLNQAGEDYASQVSQEKADLEAEEIYRSNKPTNRYYFFWF